MHIIVMTLYGFVVWFSAIAYCLITREPHLIYVVFAGPIIISTAIGLLVGIDCILVAFASRRRRAERRRHA